MFGYANLFFESRGNLIKNIHIIMMNDKHRMYRNKSDKSF